MDPLSHVIGALRVTNSECVRLEFAGAWGFRFDGYEHAHFGVITEGNCFLSFEDGKESVPLRAGDCFLLPHGHTHSLRDGPATKIRSYDEIRSRKAAGVVRHSRGTGRATTVIVGNFELDEHGGKWLIDLLPQLIAFRMDQGKSYSTMQAVLQILSLESQNQHMGSMVVVSRLAEILFVHAVRAHAAQAGAGGAGWLRAVADRQLSSVLSAMHESIDRRWTVASLAASAGISRSGFAARFKQVLGEAPLAYLTRWRMYKATQLLRQGDIKIAKVATLVGYESDAAFNKIFKRTIGVTPGEYRKSFS